MATFNLNQIIYFKLRRMVWGIVQPGLIEISLAFPTRRFNDVRMIAAATQNLTSGKLLLGWFDVILLLVLAFGFWRGRKHGMTLEFLPVSLWLVIVLAAGLGHEPLGDQLIQWGAIKAIFSHSFYEKTAAYVSSYLIITLGVCIIFSFIKKYVKPKLEGSNVFGGGEYYLGIASGVIRYFCILLFALALLNAPFYSTGEIQATKEYNNRNFGGGLAGYSGNFFPSVSDVQMSVFRDSFTGPFIREYLSYFLIFSVPIHGSGKTPVIDIH